MQSRRRRRDRAGFTPPHATDGRHRPRAGHRRPHVMSQRRRHPTRISSRRLRRANGSSGSCRAQRLFRSGGRWTKAYASNALTTSIVSGFPVVELGGDKSTGEIVGSPTWRSRLPREHLASDSGTFRWCATDRHDQTHRGHGAYRRRPLRHQNHLPFLPQMAHRCLCPGMPLPRHVSARKMVGLIARCLHFCRLKSRMLAKTPV